MESENVRNYTWEKTLWFNQKATNDLSIYLFKKKISNNFCAKTIENGSILLVPIYDKNGLHSLQHIKSASTIFFNTQKKSSFYIQNSNESKFLKKLKSTKYIILTEGFSTAASIQMAFPYQLVACSFDYGNILHVVSSFIEKILNL